MPDFNPYALRKMLALRQFPIFMDAELTELAMLAENVIEATFSAGSLVANAGRLPALHLIVEGRIAVNLPGGPDWGPRQTFGALEVLAGRQLAATAVAVVETRTLQLFSTDVAELFEDNFGILQATLRDFATRVLAIAKPVLRPVVAPNPSPLGLVDRLILMRQQFPFAKGRLQALATLAHTSEEVAWPAGATITRAGDHATASLVIIEGAARATTGTGSWVVGAGETIGFLEVLAGSNYAATLEAVMPVRALKSSRTAIFDVLEDHTDLGIAMIATFAGMLLDHATIGTEQN